MNPRRPIKPNRPLFFACCWVYVALAGLITFQLASHAILDSPVTRTFRGGLTTVTVNLETCWPLTALALLAMIIFMLCTRFTADRRSRYRAGLGLLIFGLLYTLILIPARHGIGASFGLPSADIIIQPFASFVGSRRWFENPLYLRPIYNLSFLPMFLLGPFAVILGVWAIDANLRSRTVCPNCEYDLRGSASGRCPECGQMNRRLVAPKGASS